MQHHAITEDLHSKICRVRAANGSAHERCQEKATVASSVPAQSHNSRSSSLQVETSIPLTQLFQELTYDDMWPDAEMLSAVEYLRGSRRFRFRLSGVS